MSSIDAVDYAILKGVKESETAWKKQVYQYLQEHREELPQEPDVSVQTVGRRMDRLHEEAVLESCIVRPDNLKRELIIAYQLNDAGKEALAEKREEMLKDRVIRASAALLGRAEESDFDINTAALANLVCDEFELDAETCNLVEECTTQELIALLTGYFFRTDAEQVFGTASEDRATKIITNSDRLQEAYTRETVLERVRQRLANTSYDVQGKIMQLVEA